MCRPRPNNHYSLMEDRVKGNKIRDNILRTACKKNTLRLMHLMATTTVLIPTISNNISVLEFLQNNFIAALHKIFNIFVNNNVAYLGIL